MLAFAKQLDAILWPTNPLEWMCQLTEATATIAATITVTTVTQIFFFTLPDEPKAKHLVSQV